MHGPALPQHRHHAEPEPPVSKLKVCYDDGVENERGIPSQTRFLREDVLFAAKTTIADVVLVMNAPSAQERPLRQWLHRFGPHAKLTYMPGPAFALPRQDIPKLEPAAAPPPPPLEPEPASPPSPPGPPKPAGTKPIVTPAAEGQALLKLLGLQSGAEALWTVLAGSVLKNVFVGSPGSQPLES